MKREEFFSLLKKRLSVIEKSELDDILEEYRQHIDMKMSSGKSEEEAISDFGNIDELADDILEVYHVKKDYNPVLLKEDEKKDKKEKFKEAESSLIEKIKRPVLAFLAFIKKCILGIGGFFQNSFLKIKGAFKNLFKKKEKAPLKEKEEANSESIDKKIRKNGKSFLNCLKNLILNSAYLIFNVLIFILGAVFFIFTLFIIFIFGMSGVFLVKGYPLMGIFITLLGLTAVFISATLLILTLFKRKKKSEKEKLLEKVREESEDEK